MCPPDVHPVARHQVVVIGGGIAGLTAVKVCQDHGIDAHAFERENTLGGVWNHTYKNVRLQQHKDDFRLSGTEWPANVKDFPDAKAVEGYIAKFVHEHNLACKVTSGVEVISAERDEAADEWHVILSDGRKARSKHLIVATGALGKPKQSEAAATFENFSGEVLHSSEYYDAERFHGKDVLVLGGGSSAIEIAVDLARAADSTTMSVRSDVDWVFPRHGMFGQSLRLCGAGGSAPLWLRNAAARLTFALKFGALEDYGMRPAGAPLDRRIVVSDEFYPLVKHGAIQINRGGVKSVVADEVTFADGSKRRYDAVVLCTGYEVATRSTSHPYLKKHLEEDVKLDFYLGCFLPDVPNCSFIGGCFGFAAVPRIAELQAKAAVNVISGVSPLPSPETMRRRVKRALGFHVQKGNTNVYTANAYYRQLMEAAGEIKSASAVDLSVKLKGAAFLAAVGAAVGAIHGGSDDDKTKALAAAAAAFGLAGSALNRFGRLRGRSPPAISPLAPNYSVPTAQLLHTSDSVLSMGSMHSSNSANSTTTSPATVKMAADASAEGQKIASSRFKTPKEEVKDAYEKWADAYEHDSLEKLGFASPKVCVQTLLEFCPPEGKNILDIGAGTGVLAQMICNLGHKAANFDGMDLSPGMLKHLVKKGIYNKVEAWDMMKYPWPFQSNTYDGSMCNGVLIYVDDPNCLDEFVRVMKPGGICVIMFRHDGYPDYEAKDKELRAAGKWELVHKTPDQRNFEKMEFGEDNQEDVLFNQWVFRVLEESPEITL